MGQYLTPAQASSVRFLEALYDAHPERAVGGFRPPRVCELQDIVDQQKARIIELERLASKKNAALKQANVETALLRQSVAAQQQKIESLIKEVDEGIIGAIPSIKRVITITAEFYGVKLIALCGGSRMASVARVRQIAMYLCRELTGKSYPIIGRSLGGRDHTTIMHGHHLIEKELEFNDRLNDEITLIKLRIAGQ